MKLFPESDLFRIIHKKVRDYKFVRGGSGFDGYHLRAVLHTSDLSKNEKLFRLLSTIHGISKTFRTKKTFENLFDARVSVRKYFWVCANIFRL